MNYHVNFYPTSDLFRSFLISSLKLKATEDLPGNIYEKLGDAMYFEI